MWPTVVEYDIIQPSHNRTDIYLWSDYVNKSSTTAEYHIGTIKGSKCHVHLGAGFLLHEHDSETDPTKVRHYFICYFCSYSSLRRW